MITSGRDFLTQFTLWMGLALTIAAGPTSAHADPVEDLRRCLSPSLGKPCKTEGFAGSFPGLTDPVTGKSVTGCYNFNFERVSEAISFNCPSDNAPIYLDVRVSRHCGMTDAYTGNKECTTGSYIRVQPFYVLQGDPSGDPFRFGNIIFPESIPWVLSATTILDRMFEICAELKRDKYIWDPNTRTCQKDPKFLCEDPPELGGLGLKWIGGKCEAPDPICAPALCSEKGNYCQSYLYKPAGEWCYCSGTKIDGKCNIDQLTPPGLPGTFAGKTYPRQLEVKCPACNPISVKHETRTGGKCSCACNSGCSLPFVQNGGSCACECSLTIADCPFGVSPACSCVSPPLPVATPTSVASTNCDTPAKLAAEQTQCLNNGGTFDSSTCTCAGGLCGLDAAQCAAQGKNFDAATCACVTTLPTPTPTSTPTPTPSISSPPSCTKNPSACSGSYGASPQYNGTGGYTYPSISLNTCEVKSMTVRVDAIDVPNDFRFSGTNVSGTGYLCVTSMAPSPYVAAQCTANGGQSKSMVITPNGNSVTLSVSTTGHPSSSDNWYVDITCNY